MYTKTNTLSNWDHRMLGLARYIALKWSKDPSTKVGAVITDKYNRIVSLGINGFPRGVADTPERLNNREVKYKKTVHAEANAILFAKKDLTGCNLYTWPMGPCSTICAPQIAQTGISRVIFQESDNPRWKEDIDISKETFTEVGIDVVEYFGELEDAYLIPDEIANILFRMVMMKRTLAKIDISDKEKKVISKINELADLAEQAINKYFKKE